MASKKKGMSTLEFLSLTDKEQELARQIANLPPKPRMITGRRYDVTAYRRDKRYRKFEASNVTMQKAKELKIKCLRNGFNRVDIIEVHSFVADGNGGRSDLVFTEKNYVPALVGSISYVKPRLTREQVHRQNKAIIAADEKYFGDFNTAANTPKNRPSFGPREIRTIR